MLMLVMLPMWMNFLLRTYAWMGLSVNGPVNAVLGIFGLGPYTMLNTSGAVVLGMVYNYVPYMILPLYTSMTKIDQSLVEAAQDLGASTTKTLVRVLIPMSVPGISTGITMVFVPAVSTFVISRMLGGGSNLLIGDLIEMQFLGNSYNLNVGSAMSLVLMIIVLLCMSFTSSFDEDEMEVCPDENKTSASDAARLHHPVFLLHVPAHCLYDRLQLQPEQGLFAVYRLYPQMVCQPAP